MARHGLADKLFALGLLLAALLSGWFGFQMLRQSFQVNHLIQAARTNGISPADVQLAGSLFDALVKKCNREAAKLKGSQKDDWDLALVNLIDAVGTRIELEQLFAIPAQLDRSQDAAASLISTNRTLAWMAGHAIRGAQSRRDIARRALSKSLPFGELQATDIEGSNAEEVLAGFAQRCDALYVGTYSGDLATFWHVAPGVEQAGPRAAFNGPVVSVTRGNDQYSVVFAGRRWDASLRQLASLEIVVTANSFPLDFAALKASAGGNVPTLAGLSQLRQAGTAGTPASLGALRQGQAAGLAARHPLELEKYQFKFGPGGILVTGVGMPYSESYDILRSSSTSFTAQGVAKPGSTKSESRRIFRPGFSRGVVTLVRQRNP